MGVILPGVERDGIFPSFFVGLGREEIKVCDAFWKQEMSPWSNVPSGTSLSQRGMCSALDAFQNRTK